MKKKLYTILYTTEGKSQPDYTISDVFETIFASQESEILTVNVFPSLNINIKIPGVERQLTCILDTGANSCCIDYNLVKHCKLTDEAIHLLLTATKQKIEILGSIKIPIDINGKTYVCNKLLSCKTFGNRFDIG